MHYRVLSGGHPSSALAGEEGGKGSVLKSEGVIKPTPMHAMATRERERESSDKRPGASWYAHNGDASSAKRS